MSLLLLIVIFTAIGGVLSVLAASVFLLLSESQRAHVLPHGISFAIGALLAAAFWGLIPHAFEEVEKAQFQGLSATILGGILVFFVLEKLLIWRHCHHSGYEAGGDHHHDHQPAAILILLGDGIHNFVDGILIAAAFLTDVKLGIVTSLAVAAHEIPQEVGDFAILLQSGYSRRKALIYNMLASLSTVIGGILAFFCLEDLHGSLPYFLAMAASSFIYVAVADLIPSLHEKTDTKTSLQQIALIATGVFLICFLHDVAHDVELQSTQEKLEMPGSKE
ncbi:ZIP family metal transporter [Methylicorpusculum oleiharenae]|uniref:ZIP family metal transporter n=1 Tax=Methylicorpusculum oleiharenae TaxID=1338687 RepID=UPI0013594EA5|nr:ZIP family metal transporter [Methylicorpusculum oleiharenae]MCD2450262.1 ZIP family metal transporter [Methylicorpusculum oleiharenae]